MKLIIAYIQPEKLNDVKQELYKSDIFKISVTNAVGCGQQKGLPSEAPSLHGPWGQNDGLPTVR